MGPALKFGSKLLLREAPKVIVPLLKQTGKIAVTTIIKPSLQYGRAVVTGGPKYLTVSESAAVKSATINAYTRAGMQTRQIIKFTGKQAIVRAPALALKGVVTAVKTPVRDAVSAYKAVTYVYQAYRVDRRLIGATSRVERLADKSVEVIGKTLHRVGLNPQFGGTVRGLIRLPLYYQGLKAAFDGGESLNDIRRYVAETATNGQATIDRIIVRTVPVVPGDGVRTPALPVVVPAGNAPAERIIVPTRATTPARDRPQTIYPQIPVRGGRQ